MKKFYFLLISSIFIIACEKQIQTYTTDYSKYIDVHTVNTNIEFFPLEVYGDYYEVDTPELQLIFFTDTIFPYSNYPLCYSIFIENDEMIIRFDSIQDNGGGPACPGPAEAFIFLSENINRIALLNGTTVDQYQVDISKEYIELQDIEQDFTYLRYNKLLRYIENTFFYQCSLDTNDIQIYYDFLEILINNLEIVEFTFNGDGVKPFPEGWSERGKICFVKYFQYENEYEFDKAGSLLEDFTKTNIIPNTGTSIRLRSWNNKRYLSWLYD